MLPKCELTSGKCICRDLAKHQRKDDPILNDASNYHKGASDLEKSTMIFIGTRNTGTGLHADLTTGKNYAKKIVPPPAKVSTEHDCLNTRIKNQFPALTGLRFNLIWRKYETEYR